MTGFSPPQVRRASQNFVVSLLEDERGNKGRVKKDFLLYCTQNLFNALTVRGFPYSCVCVCVCR